MAFSSLLLLRSRFHSLSRFPPRLLLSLNPKFHPSPPPTSKSPPLGLGLGFASPKPLFFSTSELESNVPTFDPTKIYSQLAATEPKPNLSKSQWDTLSTIIRSFTKSPWVSNQSLAIYIPSSFFPIAAKQFRAFFLPRCPLPLFHHLVSHPNPDEFLLPVFFDFCLKTFPDQLARFKTLMDSADMTKPHTWFPFARAMRRKIVYHCGPTNSGKTYNALQRFMEAENGVYCSPLRLLAMEVFDKVNSMGVYCSLLTGQEKKMFPFSNHIACTIEMVSTEEEYSVAVIDEIQMMSDLTRGYAWTRALLGLKAYEIHLWGSKCVEDSEEDL